MAENARLCRVTCVSETWKWTSLSPKQLHVIEKGHVDHCCLKIKLVSIIEQGTSTASRSILVKVLAASVNSKNSIELLKHCNEYGPLFLAPLWLWCLTMWVLAASTLSLTVYAKYRVFAVDSAAMLKQAFYTTSPLLVSLNHGNLLELRCQYLQLHWILNNSVCQCTADGDDTLFFINRGLTLAKQKRLDSYTSVNHPSTGTQVSLLDSSVGLWELCICCFMLCSLQDIM